MHERYTIMQQLVYTLFTEGISRLDPFPKRSWWSFQPTEANEFVSTTFGDLPVTGRLKGIGRVADTYRVAAGLQIALSHGLYASWWAYTTGEHDWSPTDTGGVPIVWAPTPRILRNFLENSYTVLLIPQMAQGRVQLPCIKRGAKVSYEILTTDSGGVAARLDPIH